MKTTLEIPDALYRAAKVQAAEQGIPMRKWVETAFRRQLATKAAAKPYELENLSFRGGELREGVTWSRILDYAYEDDSEA